MHFGVKGKTTKGFLRVDQIAQLKPTWKNRLKSTFQQLSFIYKFGLGYLPYTQKLEVIALILKSYTRFLFLKGRLHTDVS